MNMLFCLINFCLAGNLALINAQIPGGISTTTLKNIEKSKEDAKLFRFLLEKAIQNYNRASNSLFLYNIVKIDEDHIKTQVVNGIKYIVEAELAPTMCRKRANDAEVSEYFQIPASFPRATALFTISIQWGVLFDQTGHLICTPDQITGFFMENNTGL